MRSSIAYQVLGGAAMAAAMSIPDIDDPLNLKDLGENIAEFGEKLIEELAKPLDLDIFGWFDTITLEDAQAAAAGDNDSDVQSFTASSTEDDSSAAAVAPGGPCATPHVRVEWRNMKNEDRHAFLDGIKCLMDKPASGDFVDSQNRYEDIVSVHQQMTSQIHMSGLFLPWHRYYLWVFMRVLREECAYTAPFPWWDEIKDAGNFAQSPLFTDEYFGSLPGATNGQGTCITNGAFAGRTLHIGPGSSNTPHCLARAVDESQTANVNQNFFDTCNGRTTYKDMEECNEMGPHAYGHNGIGAVMAEVSASPGDPIFFMHHSFVDRMWRKWQIKDDSRLRTITGCATPGDDCTPLTLDTVLTSKGVREDIKVSDLLDIYNNFMCYLYDY